MELRKLASSREACEQESGPARQSMTFDFQLRGLGLLANEATQNAIEG